MCRPPRHRSFGDGVSRHLSRLQPCRPCRPLRDGAAVVAALVERRAPLPVPLGPAAMRASRAVAVPTEAEERRLVIRFARQWALRYPELDGLIAIHQELKFARAAATNSFTFYRSLLEQGYRPGIPDLVLPVAHWTFHGLWIELKRVRGSSVSREQRWWHEKLRGFGHLVVVAKGARPAIEWLL